MAELFTKEFVAAVSQMRLDAGSVPRGGRHSEHTSVQLGSGMEFRDFRVYVPGDDIRRIDWNLYRRSGRLFLRLFEEERDLPVYTLLDCSDSMFFEQPPRANAGKQAAAVLIGAALNQHDRPSLYPFGAALNESFPSIPNRRALPSTLERLARLGPCGPTNVPAALHRMRTLRLRRGVVVVVSDFFDPGGLDAVINGLHGLPHKLLLVQLCRESDAHPGLEGELSLEDCENGRNVRVTVTPRLIESYRQAYAGFQKRLLTFSRKRMAGYITIDAEADVLEQFMGLFANGVIRTRG